MGIVISMIVGAMIIGLGSVGTGRVSGFGGEVEVELGQVWGQFHGVHNIIRYLSVERGG